MWRKRSAAGKAAAAIARRPPPLCCLEWRVVSPIHAQILEVVLVLEAFDHLNVGPSDEVVGFAADEDRILNVLVGVDVLERERERERERK